MKKYTIWCIVLSILLPLFIQDALNSVVRDFLEFIGLLVEKPYRHLIGAILCFCITYYIGFLILDKGEPNIVLRIAHVILTFLWCANVASIMYYGL